MGSRGRPRKLQQVVAVVQDDPDTQQDVISPADVELSDFLAGLGGSGAELKLYRLERTGKQLFLASGPPSQFSEVYTQVTFGPGDYMCRAYKDGKWQGSKNFSIGPLPNGSVPSPNGSHESSELERARIDLETQRIRLQEQQQKMETDRLELEKARRENDQRNHELLVEVLKGRNAESSSINDLVSALKNMREMTPDPPAPDPMATVNQTLEMIERVSAFKGAGDGSTSWWQPLVSEGVHVLGDGLRSVAPYLPAILASRSNASGIPNPIATPSVVAQPAPVPAAIAPGQAALIPPVGAGVVIPPAAVPAPSADMVPSQLPVQPAETQVGTPIPQPAAPAPSMSPEEELRALKKQAIQIMLPYALRNANPTFCAGLAFDAIERGNLDVLRVIQELLATKNFGDWFEDMRKVEPMIFTHRDWFSELYEIVREEVAAREEAVRAGSGEQPANGDKQK